MKTKTTVGQASRLSQTSVKPPKRKTLPGKMETGATPVLLLLALLFSILIGRPSTAFAQSYSIDWYKVAGGGGISTGGTYQVSGTIGQHDAGGPMAGGSYSVTGGFWALYAVQTPGLPNLNIWFVGPDSVVVSWLNTGSYTLQTNSILSAPSWNAYGGPVTTLTGTNRVTITPPQGNLFFRLEQ